MTHLRDIQTGSNLTDSFNHHFSIQINREYYQALPPKLQAQELERVLRKVKQNPKSWLAKHWREIYGGTIK